MQLNAHLRLAFATHSLHRLCSLHATNSQAHSSKGTLSHLLGVLQRIVGARFQALFHSPPGVLFTIPSRYCSAIGRLEYLALPNGLGGFTRDSTSPALLGNIRKQVTEFRLRDSHPLRLAFPDHSPIHETFLLLEQTAVCSTYAPQHLVCNARRLSHTQGLG